MSMTVAGAGAMGGAHAMSGASWSGPLQNKLSATFDSIDTNGSGSITHAQFTQAFAGKNPPAAFQQQGAAAIYSQLDPTGSGSVTKAAFVSGISSLSNSFRAAAAGAGAADTANASSTALSQLAGGTGNNLDVKA